MRRLLLPVDALTARAMFIFRRAQVNQREFLGHALDMRADVLRTDERAHDAKAKLAEKRRREAAVVREKLQEEQQRRRSLAEEKAVSTKSNHDVVINKRFSPYSAEEEDPTEREVKNEMIREGLKARSRAWAAPAPAPSVYYEASLALPSA